MKIVRGSFLATFILAGSALNAAGADTDAAATIVGDAAAGKKVFRKCAACHYYNRDKRKTGPHLIGIVGRKIGSVEKFRYSKALKKIAETDKVWDEAELDAYLTDPRKYTKENGGGRGNMVLKLKKAQDRADVIAFLKAEAKPK